MRTKRRFLLFPKKIRNEIRWLEVAAWEEMYRPDLKVFGWYADRWVRGDGD